MFGIYGTENYVKLIGRFSMSISRLDYVFELNASNKTILRICSYALEAKCLNVTTNFQQSNGRDLKIIIYFQSFHYFCLLVSESDTVHPHH